MNRALVLSLFVSVAMSIYFVAIYLPKHHVSGVVFSAVMITSALASALRLRQVSS